MSIPIEWQYMILFFIMSSVVVYGIYQATVNEYEEIRKEGGYEE